MTSKNQNIARDREDVYTRVTNKIVAALEQGTRPWVKPWSVEHVAGRIARPLRHNGTPYRGINVLTLWVDATAKGFSSPFWLTFKQAQELNAHVRKGEQGSSPPLRTRHIELIYLWRSRSTLTCEELRRGCRDTKAIVANAIQRAPSLSEQTSFACRGAELTQIQ